jgi:hypothetical protein
VSEKLPYFLFFRSTKYFSHYFLKFLGRTQAHSCAHVFREILGSFQAVCPVAIEPCTVTGQVVTLVRFTARCEFTSAGMLSGLAFFILSATGAAEKR